MKNNRVDFSAAVENEMKLILPLIVVEFVFIEFF